MPKLIHSIDRYLNSITMYRLILYGLALLAVQAVVFGFLGILSFSGWSLLLSALLLLGTCYGVNALVAKLLKVPTNAESALITGLILFLLFSPTATLAEVPLLLAAAALSMVSKYVLAWQKKHLFNPVAITAVVLGAFTVGASWWVGSLSMLPVTLIVGLLIVRKIRRAYLLWAFLVTSLFTISLYGLLAHLNLIDLLKQVIVSWPLFFFGTIMLTEPITTPPTQSLQLIYGGLVGILFGSQFHLGSIYSTPELALVIGNLFSYIVSPKQKLVLRLKEKVQLSASMYGFVFQPNQPPVFTAGQYLEWTLPPDHADGRGNRRYFTIASAPTEAELLLGIKIPTTASSFKQKLVSLKPGEVVIAGQLAGDFTLPKDPHQKLVFIAGGIGITPFRSMVKYLMDTNQKRDIVLLYAAADAKEFVYQDVFAAAAKTVGLKTVCVVTRQENVPKNWQGEVGRLTSQMIAKIAPDYLDRTFYISGPGAMVTAYEELLGSMHVSKKQIVTDYFPGF